MNRIAGFFEQHNDYGIFFLRLVAGWRLIAGAGPYTIGDKPMQEISGYFSLLDIPFPPVSAGLSVYSQLVCGILFIIGVWTRPAALAMIINFAVALFAAHRTDGIEQAFAAWMLFATSLFLLFNGPGKLSAGSLITKRTG